MDETSISQCRIISIFPIWIAVLFDIHGEVQWIYLAVLLGIRVPTVRGHEYIWLLYRCDEQLSDVEHQS